MVTKTGEMVQQFYNKTPFPDYELERFNGKEDLRIAAYPFARTLDRSIPQNASIIDVGTGTGQLSAFLSLRRDCVWGIDFSTSSLAKAAALKKKLGLASWHLKHVDILDEKQIDAIGMQFDYVLCMGVLHHTGDAYKGFQNMLRLVKPGGHIAVGLYNTYGRIPLQVRQFLARTVFKDNDAVKDWFIKIQIGDVQDKERARGWWNDQYNHPHETTHTIGEVLRWFKRNGVEYRRTVPTAAPFDTSDLEAAGCWNPANQGYPYLPLRALQQLRWIGSTHHEGGYWVTFGRKRS